MAIPAIIGAIAAIAAAAAAAGGAGAAAVSSQRQANISKAELLQKEEQHRAEQDNQIRQLKVQQLQNNTDEQQKYISQIVGSNQDFQNKRQQNLASLAETISRSYM